MKSRIILLAVLALLTACNHKGQQSTGSEEQADSLATDSMPVATMEELMLPDTAYASAQAVVYQVDADTCLPLKYFDDLYEGRNDRVMTFRKNLRRDADFGGRVEGTPSQIEVVWSYDTPYGSSVTQLGTWGGGTGWTGQPLYAHWSEDEMTQLKQSYARLTPDFGPEEIMVGSLCGMAYFLNFETGKPSRQPLDLHNVVKGTMSLDPEMMNLYVGQGVNKGEPLGCQAFNLLTGERGFFFSDNKSWRGWQAFDSSPIVAGGYLFWPGENGSLYKFEREEGGHLKRVATLRYKVNGSAPGIESSICIYRNYGFFGDNHGNIICVNLNTMRPVWHRSNHDDTDGTIVCHEEDGIPYIYTACEVDKQGTTGICHFLKLKALDGELVWDCQIPCNRIDLGTKILDGGMYSTPLLGRGDCDGMIFANICRNSASAGRGELTAINTKDGSVIYTVPYGNFCWSSPVCFLNEDNEMFIFTGDANGVAWLIRGSNGEVLCKREMGANFESSPCVVGNAAVVGCRGTKIHKFVIK